jgi:hypothetical protein
MSAMNQGYTPYTTTDRPLKWSALLAHWTELAQAAVSLPRDGQGGRWRASVADAIALHAVAMALDEVDRLAPEERGLALDTAGHMVRRHAASLNGIWRGEAMPEGLVSLAREALSALEGARCRGVEWIVQGDRLEAPAALLEWSLRQSERAGAEEVLAALPGTVLFRGEPVAFVRPAPVDAPPVDGLGARRSVPRQVYRCFDDAAGRATGDTVAPLSAPLIAGRPLLLPLLREGMRAALPDESALEEWRRSQRGLLDGPALPVRPWPSEGEGAEN